MERRTFMKWAIFAISGLFGVVLGVPAAAFLLDPRKRPAREVGFRPVAKLSELKPGVPEEVVIRETRRDAWTLIPDDVVGRVWLIRKGDDKQPPMVECYNTTCPHLGCAINCTGNDFLCPCHGARFALDGQRIDPATNPSPRGMDKLLVEFEELPNNDKLVKVEFKRGATS